MLKYIYIDNYKSLVNVEFATKAINLLLGANGSGKSAVFECVKGVRDFVCDRQRLMNLFPTTSLTRWQSVPYQKFEFEIEGYGGVYRYEMSVEHDELKERARVDCERLFFDGKPLLRMETGEVYLYRDDFSEGPHYPVDQTLSAVGAVPPRNDNTKLTWFREKLRRFVVVQIVPPMMHEVSPQEAASPSAHLENYASWYRYISQDQGVAFQLTEELRQVLSGFDHFKFEPYGEKHRLLKVCFQTEGAETSTEYSYNELSDGQKMLIALYSLLYAARMESEYGWYTLCIDEPGNFLALPEIQPWIAELYDRCEEGLLQALIISHHPEFINYLLASLTGYWFERPDGLSTRVKPIAPQDNAGLPVSELVARGWLMHE